MKSTHSPDDLDSRILRELASPASPQWDVRVSYAKIAKKLGVDEETVRRRLKRAKERGSLPGWRLLVNPNLLGCEAAAVRLTSGEASLKQDALPKLLLVEGVMVVVDFQGASLLVNLYYSSPKQLDRATELMASIAHSAETEIWRAHSTPTDVTMRATDWKIVQALQTNARRDLREVAEETRTSRRTVERRLAAMKEGHAVYLATQPSFDAMAGLVGALLVDYSSAEEKEVGDRWLLSDVSRIAYVNTALHGRTVVTFIRENLAECERVLLRARERLGARRVTLETIRSVTISTRWQDEKLRGLLAASHAPPRI